MNRDEIIIVSGLPRSGTSMMMKILEAGGLSVFTDNIRTADEDNPGGYYELEEVKRVKEDTSWLEGVVGKGVKIISALLYDLPDRFDYRIIFMERDMKEILASQRKMLERKGEKDTLSDDEMLPIYRKHLTDIKRWIEQQPNIKVLYVNYRDVLENPHDSAARISQFLNTSLDLDRMTDVVDESLYRNRSTQQAEQAEQEVSEEDIGDEEEEKIEARLRALGYM